SSRYQLTSSADCAVSLTVTPGSRVTLAPRESFPTSTAPISQIALPSRSPSCGRATPRWSTAGQGSARALSIAGLPTAGGAVWTAPPYSPSGPRSGLPVAIVGGQLASAGQSRFPPPSVSVPAQWPGEGPVIMLLVMVRVPPCTFCT